ncbi:Lactonase, 7-bladed beta-propeller-domain-containing protein [Podospora appendiculata]|uniref:Lactonase, 7-bladed beta-propeller-domain-containing protein n=1 Tax=Podospora appendiculata TaxID=314037 RepID=A0AAE1CCG6_9PEZI|nr:Lactonase, 7-bladed beta-propeller-domain-containing protein [Podospora appendiculata]
MLYRGSLAAGVLALTLPSVYAAPSAPRHTKSSLLYVTSYEGDLTTLNFTASTHGASSASLQSAATTTACGKYPSWLTKAGSTLYCLDEAWGSNNGSLVSFSISKDGALTKLSSVGTIGGPVSSVVYGEGGRGLAVADYGGSGFNTYNIANPSNIVPVQGDVFVLPHVGVNPDRQEAPHPHQAILDPTGKFLFAPDLGSDLIHIFTFDPVTLKYSPAAPLVVAPGSGPRHITFLTLKGGKTVLYLITELSNSIVGYNVNYKADGTLSFDQFYIGGTHGPSEAVPAGAGGGEILISPDNKFLTVSSRHEGSLTINNFDKTNSTKIPSDPLITFAIDQKNGNLTWVQKFAAGGMTPRHFSFNQDGTLLAAGLQDDARVVVISRDPATGILREFAAALHVPGMPNFVIFSEAN